MDEPYIFISHSSNDRRFVEGTLLPLLRKLGIHYWYSAHDIAGGSEWERAIHGALKRCRWFLVTLTPDAVQSEWVKTEVDWAFEHRRDRILSLIAEDCSPGDLHLRLRMQQHIHFHLGVEAVEQRLLGALELDDELQAARRRRLDGERVEKPASPAREKTTPASMPEKIGPYRILKLLGTGGMGRVFLADHALLGRQVALKFLAEEFEKTPGWVDHFKRESRMLARLDHPNIVRVYDAVSDTDSGHNFFVLEYVEGGDVGQRIRGGRGLEEGEARRILLDVLGAVEHAHEMGVVHRDIKPANILLGRDGTVKVSDFGLATILGEDHHFGLQMPATGLLDIADLPTMLIPVEESAGALREDSIIGPIDTVMVAGTQSFMSPGALRGEPPGPLDDVFAVGVTAYTFLTGRLPPVRYESVRSRRPGVSKGWDRFICRCMAQRREERYPSAAETRRALAKIKPGGLGFFGLRFDA